MSGDAGNDAQQTGPIHGTLFAIDGTALSGAKVEASLAGAAVGVLDLAGLQPSSKGARIKFSDGRPTVVDGPFTGTKELIAGYWLIQVKSKEEAIDWAKHAPSPHGEGAEGEIELRQLFELEDFAPSQAIEDARRLETELANKK